MIMRSMLAITAFGLLTGLVFAQESGSSSGPKSDTNVQPSTAIQKEMTGRSSASESELQGSSNAAGAPAIEGKPGTQSGRSTEGQTPPVPPQ